LIRIIGIGSPFGDDAIGLEAARILAQKPPPNCEVIVADRPGVDLLELLQDVEAAILIDAVRSGAPAGTLHELSFEDVSRCAPGFSSTHGIGIAVSLELARVLKRAPGHGKIFGIEIAAAPARYPHPLSDSAKRSLESAVERVRHWAAQMTVALPGAGDRSRERLTVTGTVQGVGFRPFAVRLATSLNLAGFVRNLPCGVEIEIEGRRRDLDEFRARLACEAPLAAAIESVGLERLPSRGERDFCALTSERGRTATTIPPDLAVCAECRKEILDPNDRRYRYPFTNCTSCGPRFTVVQSLPYDRDTTTMRRFELCGDCRREYFDPSDRRFRAEPIACPACGPRMWLEFQPTCARTQSDELDSIARAAAILREGGIIAVQGIGGVHLACDPSNEEAVVRLRTVKWRAHKPLALMVDSLDAARRLAILSDDQAELLASAQAPIVIARKRDDCDVASAIAPGNDHLGLMLAYSPIHVLLLHDVGRPLVMTSANIPGEPLALNADEARAMFADAVDAMLLHDRPIHQRCDDSVWQAGAHGAQPIRASRGAVPRALIVPSEAPVPILGVGGDIKNSFCLLSGRHAFMSQYIGTLENAATQDHFRDSLEKWEALTGISPRVAAHDLHPRSAAAKIAATLGIEMMAVQHHHAHVAACLAEHGHQRPAIGIAFDGTGYGTDGAIWGGETILADLRGFRRLSHFEYLPLAGSDASIRHPARIAASFMIALFGGVADENLAARLGAEHLAILAKMIERRINTVDTSSCGRLFDAVAALLGLRDEITYEAQAAIELEALARASSSSGRTYPFVLDDERVRLGDLFAALLDDLRAGVSHADIARTFHNTIVAMVRRMAADARTKTGINRVALTGGCFQNSILLESSVEGLERDGFTVLIHRRVPANDGGLALGQAVVAAAQLNAKRCGESSCVLLFRGE
jgi:hydrogenase maturation protein HypF